MNMYLEGKQYINKPGKCTLEWETKCIWRWFK